VSPLPQWSQLRSGARLPRNSQLWVFHMEGCPHRIVRFGVFEADLQTGELHKSGIKVHLQGQPFQVFAILLEHSGELVTREELRERVWPKDTFVDFDHAVNTAITKIRAALADDADNPRFVETLPRRGYRFIAPVNKPNSGENLASTAKWRFERLTAKRIWIGLVALFLLCVGIWGFSRISRGDRPTTVEIVSLAGAPRGYQFTASFSPDGNQLAFDQTGERNSGIYTTLIGGEKSLRLTSNPGDCCPAWSPDGRQVAFIRRSPEGFAIYAISALGGTEHLLYRPPSDSFFHPGSYLDWSPNGKVLAFSQWHVNENSGWIGLLSLTDSTTRPLTSPAEQYFDFGATFSPDGQSVAFIRTTIAGVDSDLFVVPAAGGKPRQLTFDNQIMGAPAWTADGRDIVFSSPRGGLPTLWRISEGGSTPQPIAGVGAVACCPSISRKGNQLVYNSSVAHYGLWRVDLKDQTHVQGPPNLLISTNGRNWRPDYSPDGKRIAFESDRSGYMEIWTCDSDGSNCRQLTALHGTAGTARWSPDGRYIAFEFHPGKHSEIYVVEVASAQAHLVPTLPKGDNLAPNWSRDGQWIYFASDREGGRFDLWKVPLQGGAPVRVTKNGGVYGMESRNGRFLYYSKFESPGVWKMPMSGGEESRIVDHPGGDDWYNWVLVPNGIYFLNRAAHPRETIEFLDFATGKRTPVLSPNDRVDWGVIVSPNGRNMVYGQNDFFQSSLVLVKNFH
jgi:Tol biopolymer transport system component/DNA-binding winged helix-turn-helix (wHTH) protein